MEVGEVELAVAGGQPVRTSGWPTWPQTSPSAIAEVAEVLQGSLWTVSGRWTGEQPRERRFAEAFARYHGSRYCVATDHGTSALELAFEALDIGPGDEVIVPVLTWVANGTSVLNVNARPRFVDVDPETGCLAADRLEAAISPRTVAIVAVHLHHCMADLDAIAAIATRHGLALIEDCSQAHGARWREQPAGTVGVAGVFSFQQGKSLAGGEGGAVITDIPQLSRRMQQLRADGRVYADVPLRPGDMQLVETAELTGSNRTMSELHAALLLHQLAELDRQNELRERNIQRLEPQLRALGLRPLRCPPQVTRRAVYEYAIQCPPELFGGATPDWIAGAVTAELGCPVYRTDPPLHRSPLYRPETRPRYRAFSPDSLSLANQPFPAADRLYDELVVLHHSVLLAPASAMDDIVAGFEKVIRLAGRHGGPHPQ